MRFRQLNESAIREGAIVWVKNSTILDGRLHRFLEAEDMIYAKAVITTILPSRDSVIVKFLDRRVYEMADGEGGVGHNYTSYHTLYTLRISDHIFDNVDNKIGSFPGRT